ERGRFALAGLDRDLQTLAERVRVRPERAADDLIASARCPVLVEVTFQSRDLGLLRGERRGALGERAAGLGLGDFCEAYQALDAFGVAHAGAALAAAGALRSRAAACRAAPTWPAAELGDAASCRSPPVSGKSAPSAARLSSNDTARSAS